MPPITIPILISLYITQVKDWKREAKIKEKDVNPKIYMPCISPFLLLQVKPSGNAMNPQRWQKHIQRQMESLEGQSQPGQGGGTGPYEGGLDDNMKCNKNGQPPWTGVGGWG